MPDTEAVSAEYEANLASKVAKVVEQVRHLIDPGQVVELRALKVQDTTKGGSTWAGTFTGDRLDKLCRTALEMSGNCQGVYFTVNPLKPYRLSARSSRWGKVSAGGLASDADVLARRWALVDVDPVRAKGHERDSATDAEKAAAWEVAVAVRVYLASDPHWPACITADSGNGYHLFFRLEDAEATKLPVPEDDPLRQLLRHIAEKFDTPAAKVDTSVYNPSRIVKFPGTMTCKGSGEGDRPHRRARILEVPA